MITNDPRLAWHLACDDGQRSQHEVFLQKMSEGCEVQVGNKRIEPSNGEYAPVARCIDDLPEPTRWVGHYMNRQGGMSERTALKVETMAALAAAQLAAERLPGFKQWANERQQMFYYVARAALRNVWVRLHGQQGIKDAYCRDEGVELAAPWQVNKFLRQRFNMTLEMNRWPSKWAGPWKVLQDVISELDDEGQDRVMDCVKFIRKSEKLVAGL